MLAYRPGSADVPLRSGKLIGTAIGAEGMANGIIGRKAYREEVSRTVLAKLFRCDYFKRPYRFWIGNRPMELETVLSLAIEIADVLDA